MHYASIDGKCTFGMLDILSLMVERGIACNSACVQGPIIQ